MRIRAATVDEAAALEELQRRSSAVWDAYRDQLAAHPDAIERLPDAEILAGRVRVAEDEATGAILGFSAVLNADADGVPAELDGLFVDPDAMGRGIGRALVDDAQSRAPAAGLAVTAGPETVGFYTRCGFVRTADATTRFGPAWRWRWTSGYSSVS